MDQIIADKCFTEAKTLIQNYSTSSFIANEFKIQIVNLYSQLTLENACEIQKSVESLVHQAINTDHHNMTMFVLWCAFFLIVLGTAMCGCGYVAVRLSGPGRCYDIASKLFQLGGIIIAIGIVTGCCANT